MPTLITATWIFLQRFRPLYDQRYLQPRGLCRRRLESEHGRRCLLHQQRVGLRVRYHSCQSQHPAHQCGYLRPLWRWVLGESYDQTWPLGPLGWGETHEIGHNLQPGRLKIHGGKSTEVSNQIFPLHKHYVYRQDSGESLSANRVTYLNTFNILQDAVFQSDPYQYVYDAIWANDSYAANNGERMDFYVQLIHTSDELSYLSSGWDLYTLLYLQERLFAQAIKNESDWDAQKTALGFGNYDDAPSGIDGNDFMLVAVSYITQKDHRDFFDMWGVNFSAEASAQVAAFGFDAAPLIYFANNDTNTDPHPTPVAIDGASAYPLP